MSVSNNLKRILIVGPTGSGKTTLARRLAEDLALRHVELDALFWGPDWTLREDFAETAGEAVLLERWIIEGGYNEITERAWPRADCVVWLDLPFWAVMGRLLRRTFGRVARGDIIFSENRETLRRTLLSTDSILLWLIRSYGKRRRHYTQLAREHTDIPVARLRSQREISAVLDGIADTGQK